MDALDIKESLGAKHVKAPTPPTGKTKEARLAEAQGHVVAAGLHATVMPAAKPKPGQAKPTVTAYALAAKDDPGNTHVSGALDAQHRPSSTRPSSGSGYRLGRRK